MWGELLDFPGPGGAEKSASHQSNQNARDNQLARRKVYFRPPVPEVLVHGWLALWLLTTVEWYQSQTQCVAEGSKAAETGGVPAALPGHAPSYPISPTVTLPLPVSTSS